MADPKEKFEVTLAAVAWTQFLVVVTAVEKQDLTRLGDAWSQIRRTPNPIAWDWTAFGSLAVALNIASVCFFTFPVLIDGKNGTRRSKAVENSENELGKYLGILGYCCWLSSLVLFFGYLNPFFIIFAVVAVVIGATVLAVGTSQKKK